MTRREALGRLVDVGRISLLKIRVRFARPLPAVLMAALRALDAWSLQHRERGRQ